MTGPLALVGGGEWQDGCTFDADLLAASGGDEVVVLPTAAAYEHPEQAVANASAWFAAMGGRVRGIDVLDRSDALGAETAEVVRASKFIYLSGGSPLHLRSVLKETPVWEALVEAWEDGAVVAGSSAGAMALCEPMVDPRGGGLTVGLGLVANLAVLPHAGADVAESHRRTVDLADAGLVIAAIEERTALIRDPDGSWRSAGVGAVTLLLGGHPAGFDVLPG